MTKDEFIASHIKSIDYLLENGRDLTKYRLHKDVLGDLTPEQEVEMLEQVKSLPDYRLMLTHVKPNGYIGTGMHSWDKFKVSPFDDGEAAARLLALYKIPKSDPVVANFIKALRDNDVLEHEFSYYNPEIARFKNRAIGINSGSSLDVLIYTMQALLGFGDDVEVKPFVDCSYNAFVSLLDINSVDELTTFNPSLKRKYNYPTITPDTYFPCQYHLETLANTKNWRTSEKIDRLAQAINYHDRITEGAMGFAVKIDGKQVGPAWAYMSPFAEYSDEPKAPNQLKTLTALARVGGDKIDVVRRSVEIVEEKLAKDDHLSVTFETPYKKSCFRKRFQPGHAYAEPALEPDHKKDTAMWVELTFWAVEFLYYYYTKQ